MVRVRSTALAALALALLPACARSSATGGTVDQVAAGGDAPAAVRLGYFPNLTHAPALIALHEELFAEELAPLVEIQPLVFNAGPDAVSALFGDSLDIAYIGPNPTINAHAESAGAAIRVIAGAASGGAALVVSPDIGAPDDLAGRTLATPQLGNTQDVALRHWISCQGLAADVAGGGDVAIVPQANAEGLAAYASGRIDGAWVPEPWVTRYLRAGAHVLVDERDLWPQGRFVTTNVVVRTQFLDEHPEVVRAFLRGHLAALAMISQHPDEAAAAANEELAELTGTALPPDVLTSAFRNIDFIEDPLAATLATSAEHAVAVGLLDSTRIDAAGGLPGTLYDLELLNGLLAQTGREGVIVR